MRRKLLMVITLTLMVAMILIPTPVRAHNPSAMTLDYNADTDTLTVTVSHSVSGDHRIAQIEVWKNDVSQIIRTYEPPQETTTGMDDTFTIVAEDGDVLRVTATCSISGSITRQITIGSGTSSTSSTSDTGSGNTEPLDSSLLLYVGVATAGIVIIGLVIRIRRR